MYNINEIRSVHLEISSRCNAECPQCPRNFYGAMFNDGYISQDLTLEDAISIFKADFLQQLDSILINGNFGDIVMNPHALPIIRYFRACNKDLVIEIATNGGARGSEFWQELAELNCYINFALDGLEDTLHLYRRNIIYNTVIKNAQSFINAGGRATWKMIRFKHNEHQTEQAKQLSQTLGFWNFIIVESPRTNGPVFNNNFELEYVLGSAESAADGTNAGHILARRIENPLDISKIDCTIANKISCDAKNNKSLYITSTGEVYPCCYLGFAPRTYGHGVYLEAVNKQIRSIIQPNNAIERPLEECIQWFNQIEKSWAQPGCQQGRLLACNDQCGCS